MPENKAAIGKIGGGMFIGILVILFIAAHGRSNEMMYLTLGFVFIVILLFSYGFWSSVSKGDGIWQYWGKHNLQHQQISDPNYHFGPTYNESGGYRDPKSRVHICAPPKMGGARLNIYTIPSEHRRNSSIHYSHQFQPNNRRDSSRHSSRHSSGKKSLKGEDSAGKDGGTVNAEVHAKETDASSNAVNAAVAVVEQKDFVAINIPVPINSTTN